MSAAAPLPQPPRTIVHRTRGRAHGPIVRLVSPSDVGKRIKPFVFLDRIDVTTSNAPRFGFHPHSGIATLTLLLEGGFTYEDSTGAEGTMLEGAVEWMQAGSGVWHTGAALGDRIRGYQLWVALEPDLELRPASSQYLAAQAFQRHGPARVILGQWGDAVSPIHAPSPMNYLDVRLNAGEVWQYTPPPDHDVLWVAVHEGHLLTPEPVLSGELAVFAEGSGAVTFEASGTAGFVLGSARRHPHPLVLGSYSVHTTPLALQVGESGIRRIAGQLRREGKL